MTLRIQIHDGMIAKSTELIGKMQNYVVVKVLNDPRSNGFQTRTKIVQGSAKSKKSDNRVPFNDVLEVPLSSPNARLHFKVMDQDMMSDDVCCEGYLNVGPCGVLSPQPNNYIIRMQLPVKKDKPVIPGSGGDLRITTQYF